MKNLRAVLVISITAVIILTTGSLNFFLAAEVESSNEGEVLPVAVEESINTRDTEAIRAAYKARDA